MQRRILGRTGLEVSTIGFGTAQLKFVPRQQAINSIERAIESGINLFHTAPDYECSEQYLAEAISNHPGKTIHIRSQGWGTPEYLESLFQQSSRNLKRDYIDLYGLASVYDMEKMGVSLWGKSGLIESLRQKKREGRIGHIFCATHGLRHTL